MMTRTTMIMAMMMMVVLSYADNDKDFHDADTLRKTDAHFDEMKMMTKIA